MSLCFCFLIVGDSGVGGESQSGRKKRRDESFQARAEEHSEINVPIYRRKGSLEFFSRVAYSTIIISPYLMSGSFTKTEMLAVRKLSVWYKPRSFVNNVYPKTKTYRLELTTHIQAYIIGHALWSAARNRNFRYLTYHREAQMQLAFSLVN